MIACPLCKDAAGISQLYKASDMPLSRYGLLKSKNDVVETVSINLLFCDLCSFAWNADYDEAKVDYKSDQIIEANRFSDAYRKHFLNSKQKISKYLDISNSRLVEIGAGGCDFLELFDEARERHAIEPSPEIKSNNNPRIKKYNDYFRTETAAIPAELVIFRQVLEHVPNPITFVTNVLKTFESDIAPTYLYVEVPNSGLTFDKGRFYDIYYDHCNYFTSKSLAKFAELLGLELCDISLEHNNEIISFILKNKIPNHLIIEKKLSAEINSVKLKLNGIDPKDNVFMWGAAGNGVTMLNLLDDSSCKIEYVIDKDVNKQGKYIPKTGQLIISPEHAKTLNPSAILVMSQFHRVEIEKECRELFGKEIKLL
jgi:hypothetical protein